MATPVFFLIAGEASGDNLGAGLMRALKSKLGGDVKFMGVGGPKMLAEGLDLLFPHTELMHFGIFEVARHVPRLLKRIDQAAETVLAVRPAALITIDSPDFCFRVAKKVRREDSRRISNPESRIPLVHYVAPTVWAWRPGRAKKIATFLDLLLAVLPFEPPYFTREGLPCAFVGHSVVESGADEGDGDAFRAAFDIAQDVPLLAVLPGSRNGEISRLLPIFRETVRRLAVKHPSLRVVIPVVSHLKDRIVADVAAWPVPVTVVETEKDKFDAFAASTAALACSGTVALELALARLPSVIAYKLSALTVFLFKRFIRVRFVNLVNIMHDAPVVPEFLQGDCTPEKLAEAVDVLLSDKSVRKKQIAKLEAAAQWLGKGKIAPSARAAEAVLDAIEPPAVLQVLPALVTGGVERGTVEMTKALVKAGFRAFVASEGGPLVKQIEAVGGTHIALPLASKNPVTMAANVFRLSRVIRKYKIAIVHARSRAPAWSAYFAAKKTGAAFVTTFHAPYGAKSALKRLYNSVMAKGARVIAISDFVADYATRTYGIAKESLRVVPRGVDVEAFNPEKVDPARVDALRRAWNISDGTRVILLPGRLTRWKGQLVFIDALAQLEARDFVGIIVGGGKDSSFGKEVARAIDVAGLDKNVFVFDACADMPAAYALADIVVAPSTKPEGFGRVVIEAQAMGAFVVAADHGGAKETVIPGKTGWLTPPGDAKMLAHALETIFSMPEKDRAVISSCAIAHIRDNFTTEAMASKTLAIYREVLHKRLL